MKPHKYVVKCDECHKYFDIETKPEYNVGTTLYHVHNCDVGCTTTTIMKSSISIRWIHYMCCADCSFFSKIVAKCQHYYVGDDCVTKCTECDSEISFVYRIVRDVQLGIGVPV